jgi:hypothetical protein
MALSPIGMGMGSFLAFSPISCILFNAKLPGDHEVVHRVQWLALLMRGF